MNLSQLCHFREPTEVQHYTKAAQRLYITQPSLNTSILSLERDLGIDLFQRGGREVKLTKYGRDFYIHVCKALVGLEVGIDNAKENSGTIGSMIDVTCIPTLCGNFLPRLINSYMQGCNPTVEFDVFNDMTPAVVEGARPGAYDIGFCPMSEGETNLCFTPILSQEYTAIVNSTHPLAVFESKPMKLEDLEPYEILTCPGNSPMGRVIKKEPRKHSLKATHYGYDETTIGGYTAINQVIAIVADISLLKQFNNLAHLDVKLEAEARLVYMVYHKNNYLTPAVRSYIQHVLDRGPESSGVSALA